MRGKRPKLKRPARYALEHGHPGADPSGGSRMSFGGSAKRDERTGNGIGNEDWKRGRFSRGGESAPFLFVLDLCCFFSTESLKVAGE
jgi:hypothetical protein